MGDGGDYGGDYSMYAGDSGGVRVDPTLNMTAEKKNIYNIKSKKNEKFLAMGILAVAITVGLLFAADIVAKNIDYTKQSVENCVDSTHNVLTKNQYPLSDRIKNVYCEPVLTAIQAK